MKTPSQESFRKARSAIERRDTRYWDFLAQTGQLAGNADRTEVFVLLLARAIESGEV